MTDSHEHSCEHQKRLVLAFPSGSLQMSAPGDFQNWNAEDGAMELAFFERFTGLLSVSRDILIVVTESTIYSIEGRSPETLIRRMLGTVLAGRVDAPIAQDNGDEDD